MRFLHPILALLPALLASCSSYVTPGGPADLGAVTAGASSGPAAKYPARIAVFQVQQSGYKSQTAVGVGSGQFSVVTKPDGGGEADLRRLSGLPNVADAVRPRATHVPSHLDSAADLRRSVSDLEADHILLYTIDTRFKSSDFPEPLSMVSFGFSPTETFQVTSSASAILIDARSGHIYGSVEEISVDSGQASGWGKRGAMDKMRLITEREALDKVMDSFQTLWRGISR